MDQDQDRLFPRNGADKDGQQIPLIAVSSGKGGVGKTVLATNLARLLSWSGHPILLVDLDLQNRGSTALISDQITKGHTTLADLLEYANPQRLPELPGAVEQANLIQVPCSPQALYLLPSAGYNRPVLGQAYRYEVHDLREFLRLLVSELAKKHGFRCVVFDCGSGPETLFLAAAGLSTDIILITEADMVTWAGNLHLFSCLYTHYRQDADTLLNLQFVLNRIPEKYDIAELKQVYERRLSRFLKGRRILAAIPFDYEVFQSFTHCTFFVDELPDSVFVRHVATLADELLATTHPELLHADAKRLASGSPKRSFASKLRNRPVWSNFFFVFGLLYAIAGGILLSSSTGAVAWQAGLIVLVTGVASLLGGLYWIRLL